MSSCDSVDDLDEYAEEDTALATPEVNCELCTRPFVYSRQKRTTKKVCRDCLTNRHRWALKAKLVEYKGGGCQVCGYNRCQRSLDFHHVNPDAKDFHIAGKHCWSWSRLTAELAKCVCLCRNCHGEVHHAMTEQQWGHSPAPILAEVEAAHREWQPPTWAGQHYSPYQHWRDHHPKYATQFQATAADFAAREWFN